MAGAGELHGQQTSHPVVRRLYHGAEGGLVAGLAFILADMGWSRLHGEPATTPIRGVATVFDVSETLDRTPDALAVGIFTHAWLSAFFGVVFALLLGVIAARIAAVVRGELRVLLVAGAAYGVALYLVNYQVLGRLLFKWFTGPHSPDLVISVAVHVIYGLVLAPFFVGLLPPRRPGHVEPAGGASPRRPAPTVRERSAPARPKT